MTPETLKAPPFEDRPLPEEGDGTPEGQAAEGQSGRSRRLLFLGAGTILLIVYLWGLDYGSLWAATGSFSLAIAATVVSLNVLPGVLKYYRWIRFLRDRGLGSSGIREYLSVNASFYLGLVTPGTSGELSRAFIANSARKDRATAIVVFEKLTDFVVLALLGVTSVAVQATGGLTSWVVAVGAVGLTAVGYATFRRFDHLLTRLLKWILQRTVSSSRIESLREAYWEFYELLGDRKLAAISFLVSLALWGVTLLQMHLIFYGLGWEIPLKTTALSLFLPYLAGVVSAIPLGLGVFEVSMSRLVEGGLVGLGATAELGPLFFRFLVSVPLVVGGYLCHLYLMTTPARTE